VTARVNPSDSLPESFRTASPMEFRKPVVTGTCVASGAVLLLGLLLALLADLMPGGAAVGPVEVREREPEPWPVRRRAPEMLSLDPVMIRPRHRLRNQSRSPTETRNKPHRRPQSPRPVQSLASRSGRPTWLHLQFRRCPASATAKARNRVAAAVVSRTWKTG